MQNHTNITLLAAAALAGLFARSLPARAASFPQPGQTAVSPGTVADDKKGETHSCAGKNGCKGKGGCKTGDNGCAGENTCKGKGGCAMKDGRPEKK